MTVSDVRFSSQWATAESGTIAPVLAIAAGAGGAAPLDGAFSIAKGRDVTPEGMPVRVPELAAAALVDSLLAAAIAAILDATGLVVEVDAVGVLVLMEVLGLMAPLELTSCPAEVGNDAAAPDGTDGDAGAAAEDAAVAAAAVVVDPRRGTDAGAPVEPVLM